MSIEALQACLEAEHAAVYGYGVVGGVLSGLSAAGSPEQELAAASYVEHRRRRDGLTELITGRSTAPVAAEPAYAIPDRMTTIGDCRALARTLEDRCAQTYADAVSSSVDADRVVATDGLTACALRAVTWGARPEPFPGIAEF